MVRGRDTAQAPGERAPESCAGWRVAGGLAAARLSLGLEIGAPHPSLSYCPPPPPPRPPPSPPPRLLARPFTSSCALQGLASPTPRTNQRGSEATDSALRLGCCGQNPTCSSRDFCTLPPVSQVCFCGSAPSCIPHLACSSPTSYSTPSGPPLLPFPSLPLALRPQAWLSPGFPSTR